MPRNHRFTRAVTALFTVVALAVGMFGGLAAAHATAPGIVYARNTGPVAYELKSLLTTRFYCKVDTPGVNARLDILGANGVVKTIYNGPIANTNEFWFPAWNGLDASGRKLPSASYDWRLTITKNGESSVARGKITVSKINFALKGSLAPGTNSPAAKYYMIPGTANCYVWARTSTGGRANLFFGMDLSYQLTRLGRTMTIRYPGTWLSIPSGTTSTYYLRDPWVIPTRASRAIGIRNDSINPGGMAPTMDYYMTVIQ